MDDDSLLRKKFDGRGT